MLKLINWVFLPLSSFDKSSKKIVEERIIKKCMYLYTFNLTFSCCCKIKATSTNKYL